MRQALCPFYKLTDQGQLTKAELISKGYQSNKCRVKFNVLSIVLESYSANDWNEVHKKSVSLLCSDKIFWCMKKSLPFPSAVYFPIGLLIYKSGWFLL